MKVAAAASGPNAAVTPQVASGVANGILLQHNFHSFNGAAAEDSHSEGDSVLGDAGPKRRTNM